MAEAHTVTARRACSIRVFSNVAVSTSFLGVGLGLFDFFNDVFNEVQYKRILSGLFTFVPPLIFAVYFPGVFVLALGFASIALSLLAVIFPGMMALSMSNQLGHKAESFFFNKRINALVVMLGMGIIAFQVMYLMGLLQGSVQMRSAIPFLAASISNTSLGVL